MTTLAQLHDCHSCNDERSIVQKKVFPFYEYGMHKYVVISKTVTIVTMSAAMEPKKLLMHL